MFHKFLLGSAAILRIEPQYYDTYAVFDYRRVKTEFLTNEESAILEYIYDKPADIVEISREVGINYGRCEKFLKRMLKSGYVKSTVEATGHKPPKRIKTGSELYGRFPVPFLSGPASVDVFITSQCNQHCIHCFSNDGGKTQELSFNDLESIFDQLENIGVLEVRINGGEPLSHREIRRILSSLKSRRFRKVILTNGTLLDEDTALLLKESGIVPTVSLDDSVAADHDLFRGVRGSFKRTVEALKILQRHEIQYGINCCLHKNNLSRCEDIIGLAATYGASRIAFLDLKPVGRMRNHLDWIPSYTECQESMKRLTVARAKHKGIDVSLDVFMHCLPLKESVLEARKGYVSCQAGKTRLSIDSGGSVYPCNLVISDPQWVMGDVKKEKVWDIWFSEKWSFFRGKVKIDDLKRCKGCRNLRKCTDFYCRLLPYSTNGDPFGAHPKCR